MPQKAAEVTSSAHAMAIALYLMSAAMGVLAVVGVDIAPSLQDRIGPVLFSLWALVLMFSGLISAGVCMVPHHGSALRISKALIIEFWAALVLAMTVGLYTLALTYTGKGPTTLLFTATIFLGCLGRDAQIGWDLRRIRRARSMMETIQVAADPEGR